MGNNVQQILKERLAAEVDTRFGVELQDIVAETPPQALLGDLAFTVAFDLARKARKAPRKIAEELAPVLRETEGVEHVKLVVQEKRDGLWGVKNIQEYEQQNRRQSYLTKVETDADGPFDLAVAAKKGDAKIVVVSSRGFAVDQVAFARELRMTAQGISLTSRNPGNVTLLINSLHWLNDNTEFMNIGEPINAAVLEIPKPSTVRMVKVLTIFVWPFVALGCGGVVWWVRRK